MLSPLVAAIPYTTHPTLELGPVTLRTFGLMTATGVLLAVWFAAAQGERYGLSRDDTYKLGTRMVLAGVVGARLTWVLTHLDQIEDPIDVIAVWEGGLQFSGGFILAIAVGLPTFLRWNRIQRWQLLDIYAVAVPVGAAFGRLGCLAVGEHFGRESSSFLATRYDGGELREPVLGLDADAPRIVEGTTFLNPSLYECVSLFVLAGVLFWMLRRRLTPSVVGGTFLLAYAGQRFAWDAMRVNDERVAGLTGAQWMCLAMVPIGIYVLGWVRPAIARALEAGEVGGSPVWETSTATSAAGTEVATRKRRPAASRPAHATARPAVGDEAVDGEVIDGEVIDLTDADPAADEAGAGDVADDDPSDGAVGGDDPSAGTVGGDVGGDDSSSGEAGGDGRPGRDA